MRRPTDDLRILPTRPLVPPAILQEDHPVADRSPEPIYWSRNAIAEILHERERRLVAVVGPCRSHDVDAARAYGERLKQIADEVAHKLLIVMRAYFEKPRTNVGWKGL